MTVFLVGAGPGDPGLLTVRGAEVLSRADVVVYDRLSVASLLRLAPSHAELVSVGKAPGRVEMSQADINALLVERGKEGVCVVRLKGGDPFVFARGGEEAAALLDAGVPFEVVPGITSAIAVPAYAGIPLTLRHSSTSFTVVTGHEDPSVGEPGTVDWDALGRVGGTIVVLMGVARIGQIAERLLASGPRARHPRRCHHVGHSTGTANRACHAGDDRRSAARPARDHRHRRGGRARPRVVRDSSALRSPCRRDPCREQASELTGRLEALGAEVIELPAIDIEDPDDGGAALRRAANGIHNYDWLVLTSANGARRLLAELHDARALGGVKVAAIGPGTADALLRGNVRADLVPDRFVAEALLDAFPSPPGDRTGRVLLARAAVARDVLPEGLRERGWTVDVVDAYKTVAAAPSREQVEAAATADLITFTSSSTVERYLEVAGREDIPAKVACIGPVTAGTARAHGLRVDIEAQVHSIEGLVDAIVSHFDDE